MHKKKYKINSTPTIFINDKKYEGKHNYKDFKKEIKKLLKMKFKKLELVVLNLFLIKLIFLLKMV